MLIFHIRSLSEGTIAKKVYLEQIEQNWPGLATKTKTICKELDIEDCNTTSQSKDQYRIVLFEAYHKSNEKALRLQAKGKCERILHEDYGRKNYIQKKTIMSVRQEFRTQFGLLAFAGNYSHDRRFSKLDWLCKCKEAKESELHLTSGRCKVYGDLTHKFSNLTDDDALVQFFQEVLARREVLDKEQRNPVGGVSTNVGANSV